MFSALMLLGTSILMIISIKVFVKQMNFINKGIKKKAKIVELQSFSYITYGTEKNKIYNVGLNPVLELDAEGEKLRVDYHCYDDMMDLNEGDEVEVIYQEGNIEELTRYSKYKIFKNSIILILISILSMSLSISLMLL